MIYKFNEFNEFNDRESISRSKPLSEDEFLKIVNENCKNFSFKNDQLWRNKNSNYDMSIFIEESRKSTYGSGYSYHDFFNLRNEYPVPRYKSLIGSTSMIGAELLASYSGSQYTHLVIPFDNTQIVFTPTPDMAILPRFVKEFKDDMFIMKEYINNFKFPEEFLKSKCVEIIGEDKYLKVKDYGFEFFTNGPCLLLKKDKIDWLKRFID